MTKKSSGSKEFKPATKPATENSGSPREPPLQRLLQIFAGHPDAVVYDFDGAYLYCFIPALALDKLQKTAKSRYPDPRISAWIDKAFLPALARVLHDRDKIQRKFKEGYRGIVEEILAEAIGSVAGLPQNSEKIRKALTEALCKAQSKKLKGRMGARKRGGSEAKYDLGLLLSHHRHLHPIYRDAKKICRSNQDGNWRHMIRAKYPSHNLPNDLIDRLADPDSYQSAPSDLALEHAARLCGVPKDRPRNSYTPGYLRRIIGKLKTS